MQLFYTPDISEEIYVLNEVESWHCTKVLRLNKGDNIFLTNGTGELFKAEILSYENKFCTVKVIQRFAEYGKRNYYLHIAIAPTKNIARIEWFLEKATEIGIDEITPLICEHSERRHVNFERLNRVITSAMKQSLRAYHPLLNREKRFNEFMELPFSGSKYIAHCGEDAVKLKDVYERGKNALILIGPEGDFGNDEIIKAKEKGFVPINLGNNRYRTETAALVACHTVNFLND